MRAGLAAPVLVLLCLAAPARAQSDAEAPPVIPVHPRVPTILQLPEPIERAWITDRDDFRVAVVGNQVYVRPERGVPAGVQASLELETRTLRRTFRLRVAKRAGDASLDILVLATDGEREMKAAAPEPPPVAPAKPVAPELPAAQQPPASLPADGPSPAPEHATVANADGKGTDDEDRETTASGYSHFDLAVHALAGLGVTAVDLASYEPRTGLQFHNSLGVRLTGAPRNAWWALEVDISGQLPAGPMTYGPRGQPPVREVNGPWLQAILGMRARFGSRWTPSAYAGIGAQAHLPETKYLNQGDVLRSSTMRYGAVLALGMGLQYRARDALLGIEFQVRHGGPDEYRSITVLVTAGCHLDQGE